MPAAAGGASRSAASRSGTVLCTIAIIPSVRLVLLLFTVVAALALPAAAQAHATFVRSTPADGAALNTAPRRVVVVFDDGVEVGSGNAVVDSSRKSMLAGRPHTSGKTLTLPLRGQLPKGDYTARWSVVSDDGHEIQGVLAFSVGTGEPPGAAVLSASGGLSFYTVFTRLLALAGLLAAVGIAVFDLVAWRRFARRPLPTGTLALACALVFIGSHGLTNATHGSGWNRFSFVWSAAGVWAAVGATLAAVAVGDERVRPVAAPFVLPLVVAPTLAGHALDPGRSWIDVPIDMLHVAAAAVWLGGLVALVFAVPRGRDDAATSAARIFSRLALVSVIVVALTGVGRALAELSSVSQAWSTGYGRALLAKTALLGILVVLGWFSRNALRTGFGRLRLPVRFELAPALGLAVAGLSDGASARAKRCARDRDPASAHAAEAGRARRSGARRDPCRVPRRGQGRRERHLLRPGRAPDQGRRRADRRQEDVGVRSRLLHRARRHGEDARRHARRISNRLRPARHR